MIQGVYDIIFTLENPDNCKKIHDKSSSARRIIATHYCHFTPKMTRSESALSGLAKKAVEVKQDHPTLSILVAMRVAKFTNQEDEVCTLDAQVRRWFLRPPAIS